MRTRSVGGMMIGLALAASALAGCQNDAQSGALIGAGLGALAGQAIGGDTGGTLIGAGVGAGAGYIIGNERDKAAARNEGAARDEAQSGRFEEAPRREPAPAPRPTPAAPNALVGTAWNIVSITGDPAPLQYASIIVSFRTPEAVNTVTTYRDGRVSSSDERYVLDGDRITIWGGDYTIDGSWRLDGDVLIVSAPNFRAVGERLGG